MDPSDPARQFAERVLEELHNFQAETEALDQAFLRGRVGDLIRKYNKKYEGDEDDDGGGGGDVPEPNPETD